MIYSIIPTDNFNREAKRLSKKFRSLKNDLLQLRTLLSKYPTSGISLGNNVYKIRIGITRKGKGKSGGARIVYYVYIQEEQVFLLSIFDKSEKENITDAELKMFLENLH